MWTNLPRLAMTWSVIYKRQLATKSSGGLTLLSETAKSKSACLPDKERTLLKPERISSFQYFTTSRCNQKLGVPNSHSHKNTDPATTGKPSKAKPKQETRTQFMFPSLHEAIRDAISSTVPTPQFRSNGDTLTATKSYSTNVMGKFSCENNACRRAGWSSKKVAIVIRQHPNNRYSATVYNQRCKTCNKLGSLVLDETSYVERVAYRLNKWAGVAVSQKHVNRGKSDPHEREYCEGCKAGVCSWGVE